jgi:phospholipase C
VRHALQARLIALAAAALATGGVSGSLADDGHNGRDGAPIRHVVVIFQENITFDHYFATYPTAANPAGERNFIARRHTPAVNGLSGNLLTHNPNEFQPFRLDPSQAFTCDQDHGYTDEQKAADGGLLDRFVQATGRSGVGCLPFGQTVMGYYDGNTVTALWNYAQHYALSDNSFGTTFGPSTPGALNLVSGQTHGANAFTVTAPGKAAPVTTSTGNFFFAPGDTQATVISDPDPFRDDCGADKGVTQIGATTVEETGRNVGDLLNAKRITWGWFQGGFAPTAPATFNPDGSLKTPAVCGATHTGHPGVPNPIDGNPSHVDVHTPVTDYSAHHSAFMYYPSTRNPHHLPPTSAAMIGRTDQANHQYDIADFFGALAAGNLPAVSYVKAPAFQDGHPGNSDPLTEQSFIVAVINALQQSPEWEHTAVIINYDDSDGWYDHVTGPIVNASATPDDSFAPVAGVDTSHATSPAQIPTSGICGRTPAAGAFEARCGYGPRIPLLVISPWARKNFVDHTLTDQSSILRFIEENWNLGFIDGATPPPAGQASFDRIAGSLNAMFDFKAEHRDDRLILDPASGEIIDTVVDADD